jgi:hypothetical protein
MSTTWRQQACSRFLAAAAVVLARTGDAAGMQMHQAVLASMTTDISPEMSFRRAFTSPKFIR